MSLPLPEHWNPEVVRRLTKLFCRDYSDPGELEGPEPQSDNPVVKEIAKGRIPKGLNMEDPRVQEVIKECQTIFWVKRYHRSHQFQRVFFRRGDFHIHPWLRTIAAAALEGWLPDYVDESDRRVQAIIDIIREQSEE